MSLLQAPGLRPAAYSSRVTLHPSRSARRHHVGGGIRRARATGGRRIQAAAEEGKLTSGDADAAADEDAAYDKRAEESKAAGIDLQSIRPPQGGDPPPSGDWKWTLNWDPILPGLAIGSCPREPADVVRLAEEAGVEAIVCLQSEVCHEAMEIEWGPVETKARELGIMVTRVAVKDFDRLDQATMVPEMGKMIALCRALGKNTYIHCTAGINRASLATVTYLTWYCGMEVDEALALVREQRPQANPYMVSFEAARTRLLSGREQDVYIKTQVKGNSMEEGGDWVLRDWTAAEDEVIRETVGRQLAASLTAVKSAAAVGLPGEVVPAPDVAILAATKAAKLALEAAEAQILVEEEGKAAGAKDPEA
eukprot:jgi/Tetstr1/426560/TSEL_001636.t1